MTKRASKATPGEFHGAVRRAAALLVDDVLYRVGRGDAEVSVALDELPPRYRHRIVKDLPRWAVAFAVAGSKLGEKKSVAPSCVAEQLAMHAILTFAVAILVDGPEFGLAERVDEDRAREWMEQVLDGILDDRDYLFLYDPALDGIGAYPDEPLGRLLGTPSLAYADWVRPRPGHPGHPYFDAPAPAEDDDLLSSL